MKKTMIFILILATIVILTACYEGEPTKSSDCSRENDAHQAECCAKFTTCEVDSYPRFITESADCDCIPAENLDNPCLQKPLKERNECCGGQRECPEGSSPQFQLATGRCICQAGDLTENCTMYKPEEREDCCIRNRECLEGSVPKYKDGIDACRCDILDDEDDATDGEGDDLTADTLPPAEGTDNDNTDLVGESCGTVTPGYEDECCTSKISCTEPDVPKYDVDANDCICATTE